jgi:hypothetical protein
MQTLSKGFAALQALRATLNVPVTGNGTPASFSNGQEPLPDGLGVAPGREG